MFDLRDEVAGGGDVGSETSCGCPQSDGRKGAMPHACVSMIVPASNRAIGYYGIAFFFTGE